MRRGGFITRGAMPLGVVTFATTAAYLPTFSGTTYGVRGSFNTAVVPRKITATNIGGSGTASAVYGRVYTTGGTVVAEGILSSVNMATSATINIPLTTTSTLVASTLYYVCVYATANSGTVCIDSSTFNATPRPAVGLSGVTFTDSGSLTYSGTGNAQPSTGITSGKLNIAITVSLP